MLDFLIALALGLATAVLAILDQHVGGWGFGARPFMAIILGGIALTTILVLWGEAR